MDMRAAFAGEQPMLVQQRCALSGGDDYGLVHGGGEPA
jgi:hypothetical protein